MTPEERSILQQFLQDLAGARAQAKDPEAEAMIIEALRRNPDAAYLLVQHAVVSDQALHAAQAQIAELQRRAAAQPAPQPAYAPAPYPPQPGPWSQPPYPPSPYQPPPPYVPGAPAGYVGGGPFSGGSGLGGFLRQAGVTAAGVVGGEALFSGLSHLFGGGGFGGGFGGPPRVEEVVNNYYDDGNGGGSDTDGSDVDGGWGGGSDSSDF